MSVDGLKQASGSGVISVLRRMGSNLALWLRVLVRPPRVPGASWRPLWPLTGRFLLGAAAAIALVAVTMVVFDVPGITEARALPATLRNIFGEITNFGKSGWFLWPIGLMLLAIAAISPPPLPRFAHGVLAATVVRLGFLFVAIGLPSLFDTIIKRLIGRGRPFVPGIADPYVYKPFVWQAAYASMPSGHATTAFAAVVAIGALWPRTRLIMWIYAVVIAVSRVVITAHHPSDVVAGAIVGTVGALMVRSWFAARRLGFVIDTDGTVRRLPGPSWARIKKVARRLAAQ
jgi:membrane-associated phospholipid phosphatase